ncbi:hypothetical protein G6F22_014488 [Rhizopus arrhizus]|nr:hypothetical protein G6F22_014488 [Rhizopus arrhizus]
MPRAICERDRQDAAAPVARGLLAHPCRTEGADQIHTEDQPDHGLAEVVRRCQQVVAQVVVEGDEHTHQHERGGEQPRQAGVGEQRAPARRQLAQAAATGLEMPRRRQLQPQQHGAGDGNDRDHADAPAPAPVVGDDAGQQAPAHATDGVAADVQAHRQAQRAAVHFLHQVGHRHRRYAAQRQAKQGAQHQQRGPVVHQCGAQRQGGRREQRGDHQRAAADRIGQQPGQQHRHRQRAGGQRQRHRAAGSGHTEMTAELGQQRLHRIQQAEGGEASQEQRQRGTPEGRRALLDTGLGSGVDSVGAAFDGRRGFASHGIDGPVGTAGRGRERAPD